MSGYPVCIDGEIVEAARQLGIGRSPKKLPISHLKIDIEFVRDLVTHPDNLHVVKAIVSLARAYGLNTIAEGVEDDQALTLLLAEGVDFAQGFHLGRPGPMSDS